jgi:hypothetical protein
MSCSVAFPISKNSHLGCIVPSSFVSSAESNCHPGNVWFRDRVEERKALYRASNNATKTRIAQEVVQRVLHRNPPGRFVVRDPHSGLWNDVGAAEAHKKAKQALREPPREAAAAAVPTREGVVVAREVVDAPANLPVAVRTSGARGISRLLISCDTSTEPHASFSTIGDPRSGGGCSGQPTGTAAGRLPGERVR